jgi:probable phosphoglycerate mutase
MDKGMGKSAIPQVGKPGDSEPPRRPVSPPAPKPTRQILEDYVKGGVVHLLEGELPDGIFVKVIRE